MFSGVLGLALVVAGAGALYSLRGTPAGPHRLLKSPAVETAVALGIVLLIVFGGMLVVYGFVSALI
jgi:hypothetical protein